MKKRLYLVPLLVSIIFTFSTYASANGTIRSEAFFIEQTRQAGEVQFKLAEDGNSYDEIHNILAPFFTPDFIDAFIKENMFEENDLYYTIGTDFAPLYIPYFTYDDQTKVKITNDSMQVIVYQFFPKSTDGPVGYDDHNAAVIYELMNDEWRISTIDAAYSPDETSKEPRIEKTNVKTSSEVVEEEVQDEPSVFGNVVTSISKFFKSLFK